VRSIYFVARFSDDFEPERKAFLSRRIGRTSGKTVTTTGRRWKGLSDDLAGAVDTACQITSRDLNSTTDRIFVPRAAHRVTFWGRSIARRNNRHRCAGATQAPLFNDPRTVTSVSAARGTKIRSVVEFKSGDVICKPLSSSASKSFGTPLPASSPCCNAVYHSPSISAGSGTHLRSGSKSSENSRTNKGSHAPRRSQRVPLQGQQVQSDRLAPAAGVQVAAQRLLVGEHNITSCG